MSIDYRVLSKREDYRGSLPEVAGLFSAVFRRPFPQRGWEQWYFRNPYGEPLVILAYEGDQLIAHHALVPQALVRKSGGRCPYMLSISTMVDDRYRDLKVFGHVVGALHEAALARGVPFVLGFPNAKSLIPFKLMFGYRKMVESPLCTWIPNAHGTPEQVEPIPGLSQGDSEWSYPTDATYWEWRGYNASLRCVRLDGILEVVYKGPEDGVFTVLDLAATSPNGPATEVLARFARSAGSTAVRLTEYHARLVGIPWRELAPHENYSVRMTCRELTESVPTIRFSLLLSDVF
jgi:hypothetical protein